MGELLCEYSGDHISFDEAKERQEKYSKDNEIGCFMYYCKYRGYKFW